MNVEDPDEVRAETTKCPNDFACLSTGQCGDRELCRLDSADGKNALFLSAEKYPFCPYRITFGDREVCTCPTHFAIHQQIVKTMPSILVVDDEEVLRLSYSAYLSVVDWTCHTAVTYDEALRILQSTPDIGFVLLDYDVGGHTPDEIVDKLRGGRPDLQIVGNSGQDRRREFAALGISRFLAKPCEVSDLRKALGSP